jgi:hypothetical protein
MSEGGAIHDPNELEVGPWPADRRHYPIWRDVLAAIRPTGPFKRRFRGMG